jgi:hypothetical protein
MSLQIVTANRLGDGRVVYLDAEDRWSPSLREAALAEGAEAAEALLAKAEQHAREAIVVGPYLIAVHAGESGLEPSRFREVIRALGPSVRSDLGYQAQGL